MANFSVSSRQSVCTDIASSFCHSPTETTSITTETPTIWLNACEDYFANVCRWGVFVPPDIRDQCLAWGRQLAWDWPRFHTACDRARLAPSHPPRTMRQLLRIVGDYLPAASQWAAWITDPETVWPRGWDPHELVMWLPAALVEAEGYHWSLTTPADPLQARRMRLVLGHIRRSQYSSSIPREGSL